MLKQRSSYVRILKLFRRQTLNGHRKLTVILVIQDSELEAKTRELDIARETVEQLKTLMSNGAGVATDSTTAGESTNEDGDGWDCEDAREYIKTTESTGQFIHNTVVCMCIYCVHSRRNTCTNC